MIIAKQIEPYLKNLRGALHVGANIGEERYWYKEQGFTQVVWFEPNKELFPILKRNLKEFNNQVAFNIGIHDTLRAARLHISSNDGQSSSILELGLHSKYHPEVVYIKDQDIILARLDEFLFRFGFRIANFNFLNVDVQGVELNVLKSLDTDLSKLQYIYLEVNDEEVYKGCSLLPEIDEYLDLYNFARVKILLTKAHWGDAFYVKKTLL